MRERRSDKKRERGEETAMLDVKFQILIIWVVIRHHAIRYFIIIIKFLTHWITERKTKREKREKEGRE